LFLKEGKIIANDTPEKLAQSLNTAHMTLRIEDGLKRVTRFCKEQSLEVEISKRDARITIDEQQIATFLILLASEGITYSQIAIDTPTLEDYFLSVSTPTS